ncbi:MAG: hypothetical protein HOJ07_00805 [Rhodospirillaceae bacterium]|jgi:hypothetical protein|nr:hypothetical protein [Rhodospirillaceae bacterium]MBT3927375.1 hypothetical protein [Rhodospirillaceae bacterium]MBT4425647.1 hypothetical protein [Rhodospirillaceae bacterium]MBT5674201.1 hypothetical protein [Rhodospirillaceae bacterium]MBT5778788.1 hypothetical protein [Rhodospirillaceae bacterium]
MTPEEAHALAGKYGLEFRFDHDVKSWALGPPVRNGHDERVWISPHVLSGLSADQMVRHYINEVLNRAGEGGAMEED